MPQNGRLEQTLKTQQRLTQQQLRFVKLLELNAPELEEAVVREVEENPALTLDPADHSDFPEQKDYSGSDEYSDYSEWSGGARQKDLSFAAPDMEVSLYDHLTSQLGLATDDPVMWQVAEYIIGNLDNNGYLQRGILQISDDLAIDLGLDVDDATIAKALRLVQSLDPAGVGAKDVQEALLLQLKRMRKSQVRDDAITVIKDFFPEFTMKHTHKIVSGSKMGVDRVKDAVNLILTLNPKPGGSVAQGVNATAPAVIPDYLVENDNGRLSISLNNKMAALRIDESFEEAYRTMKGESKNRRKRKGSEFVTSRYNAANDFIRILSQRQRTLMNIMVAIVKLQKEYFLTEDTSRMRPMVMKDVAAETGFDISVISRATSNKYVSMPWGDVLPVKFFFSDEKGGGDAGGVTDKEIKMAIRALVDGENKRRPLSDDAIQKALLEKGYDIKRRTVAKYRNNMDIPVARLRKENI